MKRRVSIILILLTGIFSCDNISSTNSNLAFVTYISRLTSLVRSNSTTASSAIPKIISTDFISNSTLAPVVISKIQTLGVTFDTTMSITGCNIKVNGVIISGTTTASDDKLTLSFKPATSWGVDVLTGLNLDLSSECKSEGGVSYVPGTGINVYIADSLIYVDSIAGNDSNTGTMSSPIKTLPTAITSISSTCTGTLACAIALKGGNYSIAASIVIPANLSIFGGFDPSDWTKRRADKTNLSPYDTIITDTSTGVTGTGPDPYSSIKYSNYAGTKEKSILDGIIVNGPISANAGSYVSPIGIVNLQSGAGVTIRNTVTNDLSSTLSVTSVGFVSANSAGTINLTNNKFNASLVAGGSSTTHGIVYNSSTSTSAISISNCDIDAGISSTNSMGFNMTSTNNGTISINKNTITARNCSSCDSTGVTASFATANGMSISENTITTGTGINSFGINFSNGSGLTVSKNTITTNTGINSSKGITTNGTSLNLTDNIINAGIGGIAGSVGVILNSGGSHTISGNTINSSNCNVASCQTGGINLLTSATLSVSNNTIISGTCSTTTCTSVGIHITGTPSTSTIANNTITAGGAVSQSYGIFLNSAGTKTITGNTITSGTSSGSSSYGVEHITTASTIMLNSNVITSGAGTNSIGFDTSGASSSTFNISGNTITGGTATSTSSGLSFTSNSSTFNIDNNIITGGSAGTLSFGLDHAFGQFHTTTNNTITAGSCTGGGCTQRAYRQAANNSTLTITGNILNGGVAASTTSTRIALDLLDWPSGAANIQRNTFLNQTGVGTPTTVQIASQSKSINFCSNVLIGGGTSSAVNASTLKINSNAVGNAHFVGNTIIGADVPAGSFAYPVELATAGTSTFLKLDQNIISGHPNSITRTTCIRESGNNATYATLVLNNVDNCGTSLYDNFGPISTSISGGNFATPSVGSPTGMLNMNSVPVFINFAGNDFHLDASTPAGILNGLTESSAPNDHITKFNAACGNILDRNGNTRTSGTAIGAYK